MGRRGGAFYRILYSNLCLGIYLLAVSSQTNNTNKDRHVILVLIAYV